MHHFQTLWIIVLFLLVSCSPGFYLKNNNQISNFKLNLTFNERIKASDRQKIMLQASHTISEWNLEKHAFAIELKDSGNADLYLKIDSVFIPSQFIQTCGFLVNSSLWFWGGFMTAKYNNPYFLFFSLISFQVNDITLAKYRLNETLTDNVHTQDWRFITKTKLFNNRDKERNSHIRNFDEQLYQLIEKIEKEYRKKNNLL